MDAVENREVRRAVHDRRFIQGYIDVLKELYVNVDRDDIGTAHDDHVTDQGVDEMQVVHDLIQRYLHGNARKQRGKEEQVADRVVSRKLKPVQHIGQLCADEHRADQHADQNDRRVEECPGHVCLLKRLDKVVKIQPALGERHHVGLLVFHVGLKRRDHTGNHRDHRDKGEKYQ